MVSHDKAPRMSALPWAYAILQHMTRRECNLSSARVWSSSAVRYSASRLSRLDLLWPGGPSVGRWCDERPLRGLTTRRLYGYLKEAPLAPRRVLPAAATRLCLGGRLELLPPRSKRGRERLDEAAGHLLDGRPRTACNGRLWRHAHAVGSWRRLITSSSAASQAAEPRGLGRLLQQRRHGTRRHTAALRPDGPLGCQSACGRGCRALREPRSGRADALLMPARPPCR